MVGMEWYRIANYSLTTGNNFLLNRLTDRPHDMDDNTMLCVKTRHRSTSKQFECGTSSSKYTLLLFQCEVVCSREGM